MASDFEDLPNDWEVRELGELAEKPQYGLTASAVNIQVGPRFLRITDIQDGGVSWPTVPYCICPSADFAKCSLSRGDLVIARIGATTGKAYLIEDPPEAVFASYLIRIRTNASVLLPEFLDQFTKTSAYWQQINETKGGRLKQGVNIANLQNLRLPVPTLSEQRAIAHVLHTVQRAKEATEKVIAAARELKKSLMKHLFTYGPVPFQEANQIELTHSDIGSVPRHWAQGVLSDHVDFATGGTPSRNDPSYWNGDIPWVKTGEIRYSTITSTEEFISQAGLDNSNARIFPAGTLLVAMYGQGVTRGRIGRLGIEAATNQACAALFPRREVIGDFIYYMFENNYNRIRDMGHGANQRNLSITMLKTVSFHIPPLNEQQRIAEYIAPIDAKLNAEHRKRDVLHEIYCSLLQRLMTGAVRVHDIDVSEVGEVLTCQ